jgi:hypothetical protein
VAPVEPQSRRTKRNFVAVIGEATLLELVLGELIVDQLGLQEAAEQQAIRNGARVRRELQVAGG